MTDENGMSGDIVDPVEMDRVFTRLQDSIHADNARKGFWTGEINRSNVTKLALIHSEVSELMEEDRKSPGTPRREFAPGFSGQEEEAADIVIRVLDLCAHNGWDLAGAVRAKMRLNAARPVMHGKRY